MITAGFYVVAERESRRMKAEIEASAQKISDVLKQGVAHFYEDMGFGAEAVKRMSDALTEIEGVIRIEAFDDKAELSYSTSSEQTTELEEIEHVRIVRDIIKTGLPKEHFKHGMGIYERFVPLKKNGTVLGVLEIALDASRGMRAAREQADYITRIQQQNFSYQYTTIQNNLEGLRNLVRHTAGIEGIAYIAVYNPDMRSCAQSDPAKEGRMPLDTHSPHVKEAFMTGEPVISEDLTPGMIVGFTPVVIEARHNGAGKKVTAAVIEVAVDAKAAQRRVDGLKSMMVETALILTASTILVLLVSLRTIVLKPVGELTDAAIKASQGELDQSITEKTKKRRDELGYLAASFDMMLKDIKESRDGLIKAAEFTDSILKSMNDGMFVVDDRGNMMSVNDSAVGLAGAGIETLRGRHISELIKDAPSPEEISRSGDLFFPNAVLTAANGRPMPVQYTASRLRGESGRGGSVFIVHDITMRKKAEDERRRLEAFTEAFVDTALDAIVTIDENGIILTANPATTKIFGYGSAELVGRNIKMLMPQPYRDRHDDYIKNYLKTGERGIIGIGREVVGLKKDGTVFPADISVTEAFVDDRRIFAGVVRDISAGKAAEDALKRLSSFPELNPAPVVEVDVQGGVRYMNPSAVSMIPYLPAKGLEHPFFGEFKRIMPELIRDKTRELKTAEVRVGGVWYEQSMHYIPELECVRIYAYDITERKRVEEAHRKSEAMLAEAQSIARLGSWEWDIATGLIQWSDEIYAIFGLDRAGAVVTYDLFLSMVHPEDREAVKGAVDRSLGNENIPYEIEHRVLLGDGGEKTVRERGIVRRASGGRPASMVGTVQDITEQKKAESELKMLSRAIEESINIIYITDSDGRIQYVNPMFEKAFGYTKDEAVGQNPKILVSVTASEQSGQGGQGGIRGTFKFRKKDGSVFWGSGIISPILDSRGEITHYLMIQEDITERVKAEERAQYLSTHDKITGIINRDRFMEVLDKAMANTQNGALLLMDIDGFKFINDAYGIGTGDEFLRRIVSLVSSTLDDMNLMNLKADWSVIGRMGEDEFAVFLTETGMEEGRDAAEKIRKRIEAYRFMDMSIRSTVSIGVALYPDHALTAYELYTRSTAAVYRAKDLGKNRVHVYRAEDRVLEELISRLVDKETVIHALDEDQFEPWFQPIMDLRDMSVHHYEALARIRKEDGSIILPASFISTAERFGMIGAIDKDVIGKTLAIQSRLARGGRTVSFTMNISGKNLGDEELLKYIREKIAESGASGGHLIFEITETSAINDLGTAVKFIKSLKDFGCRFSLDDFGVGFTSFVYLRELQVDYLKIDGSFIKGLADRPENQLLVKAMTDMAHVLGILTIAEYVEEESALELLKMFGVDYAQGHLIGKPSYELLYGLRRGA